MKVIPGLDYFPNYLSIKEIDLLNEEINLAIKQAPFFVPTMPKTAKKFSVKITNMGNLGWVSDRVSGYRYQDYHPVNYKKWPKISDNIINIWQTLTNLKERPDCCLINHYDKNAKMGLHVDNDENDFSYPVLSISLGNSALFRFGGLKRNDKTKSFKLNNGDALMMHGPARLIYHGIDKVYASNNFNHRINLTLRKI
jgi:alkylated DNA repair protein (DNA oxidative demethylase)